MEFFATAHGKGPCDGVGGTLKGAAARATLQLPPDRQITTRLDLYRWASTHLPHIQVEFCSKDVYDQVASDLKPRFDNVKKISGTQKIHCVIPQEDGIVKLKPFSRSEEFKLHRLLTSG